MKIFHVFFLVVVFAKRSESDEENFQLFVENLFASVEVEQVSDAILVLGTEELTNYEVDDLQELQHEAANFIREMQAVRKKSIFL